MPEELQEFEFVESRVLPPMEVVLYRDMDDLGRVFVTEEVLRRFHIKKPEFNIQLDRDTVLYEIRPRQAKHIIEHDDNKYAPYTVRFQNFDFNNELRDEAAQKNGFRAMKNIIIYRDIDNPKKAYVKRDVLKRFHIAESSDKVQLGQKEAFAITPIQVINIVNNANNEYAPYHVRYVNVELSKKEEMPQAPIEITVATPRKKHYGETPEHYSAYLEGFYDGKTGEKRALSEAEELAIGKKYADYLLKNYYKLTMHKQLEENARTRVKNTTPTVRHSEEYEELARMVYGENEEAAKARTR